MSCGCRNNDRKSDEDWILARAKQIAELRKEDVQIYLKGGLFEIEFPLNNKRENIVKVIKWQELE